jgi:hypothetical protein
MLRRAGALSTKRSQVSTATRADIVILNDACEDRESSLWLVVWYLVASVVDAGEGEVAVLPYLSADEIVQPLDGGQYLQTYMQYVFTYYRQRGGLRVVVCLDEPEKGVYRVVLLVGRKRNWKKVDIA